jgi:hypothetical protein
LFLSRRTRYAMDVPSHLGTPMARSRQVKAARPKR